MAYYYVLDRWNCEDVRVTSLKEAMAVGEQKIEDYRGECGDDGWPEAVENIEIYKTAHVTEYPDEDGERVAKSMREVLESRPDDVREDGYAKSDNYSTYWGEHFMEIVDFKMQKLTDSK